MDVMAAIKCEKQKVRNQRRHDQEGPIVHDEAPAEIPSKRGKLSKNGGIELWIRMLMITHKFILPPSVHLCIHFLKICLWSSFLLVDSYPFHYSANQNVIPYLFDNKQTYCSKC